MNQNVKKKVQKRELSVYLTLSFSKPVLHCHYTPSGERTLWEGDKKGRQKYSYKCFATQLIQSKQKTGAGRVEN